MRGNRARTGTGYNRRGSIPACAGEPARSVRLAAVFGVYPRVCGGTYSQRGTSPSGTGLSPRVRGNRAAAETLFHRAGSIPACAGEPVPSSAAPSRIGVYPRVCGGTRIVVRVPLFPPGLSPRVRGNRRFRHGIGRTRRSIPACAGEPDPGHPIRPSSQVYPRVCGGTRPAYRLWRSKDGLSPRVRGNRDRTRRDAASRGSIPACAGEPMHGLSPIPQ